MSDFKIEKAVPRSTSRARVKGTFPFKDMEVGDSFLIPVEDKAEAPKLRMRLYQAAWRANIKVSTETVAGGIRVWLDGPRNDPTLTAKPGAEGAG